MLVTYAARHSIPAVQIEANSILRPRARSLAASSMVGTVGAREFGQPGGISCY
jgi:hypothetical protein